MRWSQWRSVGKAASQLGGQKVGGMKRGATPPFQTGEMKVDSVLTSSQQHTRPGTTGMLETLRKGCSDTGMWSGRTIGPTRARIDMWKRSLKRSVAHKNRN